MNPRLSIVVPFYNVEPYIGACLDSLARQTFRDFEVVLVDDGSRDGSAQIARTFCDQDPRFRIVTQENQGLGPARNTGVQHSQGEYLTFVDSDDLVSRHAYDLMIRSLDETASSLAAGNARRFNNTSGVRQSYVHRIPFAKDRPATHVFDYPALALDRMVWNKVYRRSFWDQFRFAFPAIRYEDYPVTLRGHIEAITVDCISAPVYYWRERESGESITQQKFQYANLHDRVTSAEMVFDLIDKRAPELRAEVHRHLALTDMATVVQAFATAPEDELRPLLELGRRLSRRLDQDLLGDVRTFERLQYYALQTGDVELLQRLARFRAEGGLAGGARAQRNPVLPWQYENRYPGLHGHSGVPSRVYRLPREELALRTRASEITWTPDELVISGTAEIAHVPTENRSSLRISLISGGRRFRLPVQRRPGRDTHGEERLVDWTTRVPRSLLAEVPPKGAHLSVDFRNGHLRRRGPLTRTLAGNVSHPAGQRVGDAWIQPTWAGDGRLMLRRLVDQPELATVEFTADELVFTGRLPAELVDPELRLTRSSGYIRVPLDLRADGTGAAFTARIRLDDLVDEENADDPFTGRTHRVPSIYHDDGSRRRLLLITGLDHAVTTVHHGRMLSVTRSPGMFANLGEAPVRIVVDRIESPTDGTSSTLVVSGPQWPGVTYDGLVWRRFRPNSDDAIDVPCRVKVDGSRWVAEADTADLLLPADGEDGTPDWTLFASDDGTPYAVQTEPFLLSRLPATLIGDGRRGLLQSRAGTLHLETS
ncbi:glycosyltransferase family 2 protein [Jidongwangia harbinensis]|uniref:glycosyltransferase family 2 protein n=1 Tax=Jidongwangia harbinensis TaxID=2878561 RepID=UPI001CD9AB70|nr:glycosyltransferase [Jidongwangia harbinensis]MCA2217351.1 glycosyltransferase [Jidongwangia harbinensis]